MDTPAQLSVDIDEFVGPILQVQRVDLAAYDRVLRGARDWANEVKDVHLLPKWLLAKLAMAINVARNEAPYIDGGTSKLAEMARELDQLFYMILDGEGPEDRVPGKPRIL